MFNNTDKGFSPINGVEHLKQGKRKIRCKHCGEEHLPSMFKRWHGINCKQAFVKKGETTRTKGEISTDTDGV